MTISPDRATELLAELVVAQPTISARVRADVARLAKLYGACPGLCILPSTRGAA